MISSSFLQTIANIQPLQDNVFAEEKEVSLSASVGDNIGKLAAETKYASVGDNFVKIII